MKIFAALCALIIVACSDRSSPPNDWQAWSRWVEARYPVSDAQGHGPDIGSDEWRNAVQEKMSGS